VSGRIFQRPLIPLLVAFAAGIVLGESRFLPTACAWAAAGLCLLWCIQHVVAGTAGWMPPVLLFLFLGSLAIHPWVDPRFPPDHVVHASGRFCRHIQGKIVTAPVRRGGRISFIIAACSLGDGSGAVQGQIRAGAGLKDGSDLRQGDEIRFAGRIRRIRSFENPGGFDYERFMAFQDVQCSVHIRKGSLDILSRGRNEGFHAWISEARRRIRSRIAGDCPGPAGDILPALLIGEKSLIQPALRERFNRAGIGHLLAISGLHIGSITALSYSLFRWLLAFAAPLLWNGWLRKAAAGAALVPVVLYAALAQWPPSTQRAVCMAAAVCLSLWFEREVDVANSIAVAALVILVVFPPALFSISFQLSFAAVIAIVAGMPLVSRGNLQGVGRTALMKRKVLSFTAMSFFAVMGTLPLSMLYFNQVSFVGIVANLVYIPLVGCLVLPLGLLSMLVFPVSTGLAGAGFMLCGKLLDGGLYILPLFSELPFGSFVTVTPTMFETGLYYAACGALLMLLRSKRAGSETSGWKEPGRSGRRAALLWGMILLAAAGDVLFWTYDRFLRDDLRVTVIDVGQGSSALVEFPRGYRMLIDGGGYYDRRIFDVGERVVAPFLLGRKILTLDAVVLSHPDSDHLNGLIAILERFHVKALWTSGAKAGGENYAALTAIAEKKGIPSPPFNTLPRRRRINGATLAVVYPPAGFELEDQQRGNEEWRGKSNNRSVVISVRLGGVGILFPGDIEAAAESDLVAGAENHLRHRVLVAPHHGSRTSSSEAFLDSVAPEYVMVSAGRDNRFRCPHPRVTARYRRRGVRMLRTDTDGALHLSTDGRTLAVRPADRHVFSVLAGRVHDILEGFFPVESAVVLEKDGDDILGKAER